MSQPHRPDDRSVADTETDTLLIGRIQCGDESALGRLYDRWVDRVYSVAAHVLGTSDDADDVVERTFSQIWKDAGRYDPERGSAGAWIVTIARSHALTLQRAEGRRARHDELRTRYLLDEGTVSAASPLQNLEASEDRELIQGAMSRLPDEQERVVRMAFYEGLSQTEISDRLGVPLGTVKTRVRLAFAKLRTTLDSLRERAR
jgi:RNA polymerase sigma-70 factor (ECF subfamily)